MTRPPSFRGIEGGRIDAHPPLPAFVPDRVPQSRDTDAARGLLIGLALSVPVWVGLGALAWWARVATGCRS